jgi:hypothetical protein
MLVDRDDHLSFGVASLEVSDGIWNFCQCEGPVNHGQHIARLEQSFDQGQILLVWFHQQVAHFLIAPGMPRSEQHGLHQLRHLTAGHDVTAIRCQGAFVLEDRTVAIDGKDQVVPLCSR